MVELVYELKYLEFQGVKVRNLEFNLCLTKCSTYQTQ